MIKVLKNKKGMTIIELVAAMVIFSIMMVSVSTVFVPILNSYRRVNDMAETNLLLDTISAEMLADINRAVTIGISDSALTIDTGITEISYLVTDGYLEKDGDPLLDDEYYKRKTVEINYYDNDGNPLDTGGITSSFYIELTILRKYSEDTTTLGSRKYVCSPLGTASYKTEPPVEVDEGEEP